MQDVVDGTRILPFRARRGRRKKEAVLIVGSWDHGIIIVEVHQACAQGSAIPSKMRNFARTLVMIEFIV